MTLTPAERADLDTAQLMRNHLRSRPRPTAVSAPVTTWDCAWIRARIERAATAKVVRLAVSDSVRLALDAEYARRGIRRPAPRWGKAW